MNEMTMRERKKETTKINIITAATKLFNTNGFAYTTMQMIAEEADVALRTLYNYFPSKESIVATYIQMTVRKEVNEGWQELLELDTTYERMLLMLRKSAEWIKDNVALMEVYASDPRNYYYGPTDKHIPRSGYDEVVARVMELGRQMGDLDRNVSVDLLTRQFMGVYYFGILTWLGNPGKDLFEIFSEGLDLLFRGINPGGTDPGEVLWALFS